MPVSEGITAFTRRCCGWLHGRSSDAAAFMDEQPRVGASSFQGRDRGVSVPRIPVETLKRPPPDNDEAAGAARRVSAKPPTRSFNTPIFRLGGKQSIQDPAASALAAAIAAQAPRPDDKFHNIEMSATGPSLSTLCNTPSTQAAASPNSSGSSAVEGEPPGPRGQLSGKSFVDAVASAAAAAVAAKAPDVEAAEGASFVDRRASARAAAVAAQAPDPEVDECEGSSFMDKRASARAAAVAAKAPDPEVDECEGSSFMDRRASARAAAVAAKAPDPEVDECEGSSFVDNGASAAAAAVAAKAPAIDADGGPPMCDRLSAASAAGSLGAWYDGSASITAGDDVRRESSSYKVSARRSGELLQSNGNSKERTLSSWYYSEADEPDGSTEETTRYRIHTEHSIEAIAG